VRQSCKTPAKYTNADLAKLGFMEAKGKKLFQATAGGCQQCRGTGYSGRVALYEIAIMTPAMQTLVSQRAIRCRAANPGAKGRIHHHARIRPAEGARWHHHARRSFPCDQ
jgi:type II secretory ATPase GspE/PulE/Tfp pilus assembly ATPase PilB-like protein